MKVIRFLFCSTLAVSMSANAGLFQHTKGWQEEIQVNDGGVMVVRRVFNLGGYPTFDAHERALIDEAITFTLPGSNKKISWKTEFRNDLPEPTSLSPLLLDVVAGVPYLATSPAGCLAYNQWGRPNPPYILFKYINDAWQRIDLKDFPGELVHANLIPTPASSLIKPYYTLETKKAEWESGNMHAYAKTIVREQVKERDAITSCEELVHYKCGWGAPGEFNKQYFERICK